MALSSAFPSHSPSSCLNTVDLILFKIPILMTFCICCWFWQRVVNKLLAWIAHRQILHALMWVLNLACHCVYIKQFLLGRYLIFFISDALFLLILFTIPLSFLQACATQKCLFQQYYSVISPQMNNAFGAHPVMLLQWKPYQRGEFGPLAFH